jgi:hypothetical protein
MAPIAAQEWPSARATATAAAMSRSARARRSIADATEQDLVAAVADEKPAGG